MRVCCAIKPSGAQTTNNISIVHETDTRHLYLVVCLSHMEVMTLSVVFARAPHAILSAMRKQATSKSLGYSMALVTWVTLLACA